MTDFFKFNSLVLILICIKSCAINCKVKRFHFKALRKEIVKFYVKIAPYIMKIELKKQFCVISLIVTVKKLKIFGEKNVEKKLTEVFSCAKIGVSFFRGNLKKMDLLEQMITTEGKVLPGNILKVDGFLNHQVDPALMDAIGAGFFNLFKDDGVTKVLTIESSGIAAAVMTAYKFGVPMVFAKKGRTANISPDVYTSCIHSYTHGVDYNVTVAKEYLSSADRVLIIDDFLANGKAVEGLMSIVKQSGATVAGVGIVVEKAFQKAGDALRAQGVRLESLAQIESMSEDGVVFRK